MGGPAVGEARRQPPAAIRSGSLGHWPATGSKILPGPEGGPWMRGGSCITCGHRPPGPRAAGSSRTGAST